MTVKPPSQETSAKKLPLKPRLSRVLAAPTTDLFPEEDPFEDVHCVSRVFEDTSVAGREGDMVVFDRSILRRIDLSGTRLGRVTLRDAALSKCDMANAVWRAGYWNRVELQNCRMTGLDLAGSSLSHITFTDCKADLACFSQVTCKAVNFENCGLHEVDFQGADLRGCSFRGCDLRGAQLSETKLDGVDLRDAKIEGIVVAPDNLRNVTVDLFQAAYLAGLMGLIIK